MKKLSVKDNENINKWFEENTPDYYIKDIPADQLKVDASYQRDLKPNIVRKIVREFNWFVVNDVKVAKREDGYYVFDGQHTVRAIVEKTGKDNYPVRCKVYADIPYEIECILFSLQTGTSSKVKAFDKIRADKEAGCKYAVDIYEVIDELGINTITGGSKNNNGIQLTTYIKNTYDVLGKEGLKDVLEIILKAYGAYFTGNLVKGVAYILDYYGDKVDREKLVKLLKKISKETLVMRGRETALRYNAKVPRAVAYVLAEDYRISYGVPLEAFPIKDGKKRG